MRQPTTNAPSETAVLGGVGLQRPVDREVAVGGPCLLDGGCCPGSAHHAPEQHRAEGRKKKSQPNPCRRLDPEGKHSRVRGPRQPVNSHVNEKLLRVCGNSASCRHRFGNSFCNRTIHNTLYRPLIRNTMTVSIGLLTYALAMTTIIPGARHADR